MATKISPTERAAPPIQVISNRKEKSKTEKAYNKPERPRTTVFKPLELHILFIIPLWKYAYFDVFQNKFCSIFKVRKTIVLIGPSFYYFSIFSPDFKTSY